MFIKGLNSKIKVNNCFDYVFKRDTFFANVSKYIRKEITKESKYRNFSEFVYIK